MRQLWQGGGGTTNRKILVMMQVQVLGTKLREHFKMFHGTQKEQERQRQRKGFIIFPVGTSF